MSARSAGAAVVALLAALALTGCASAESTSRAAERERPSPAAPSAPVGPSPSQISGTGPVSAGSANPAASPTTVAPSAAAGGGSVPAQPEAARSSSPATAPGSAAGSAEQPERLRFSELYKGASITQGLILSDKVKALNGQRVTMTGYMSPPLKASFDFFVLTRVPMAICPFCSTDADWPDDIVLVLLDKAYEALPYTEPIEVTGSFEVGSKTDEQTGFYSLLRIRAQSVKVVK